MMKSFIQSLGKSDIQSHGKSEDSTVATPVCQGFATDVAFSDPQDRGQLVVNSTPQRLTSYALST